MGIWTKFISGTLLFLENLFFYPKLRKVFKGLLSGDSVIIDVGANKGQSIDFFRSINRDLTIHSFEPNPDLFRKLTSRYAGIQNVHLHNEGVSSESGMLEFNINHLDLTSSFEKLNMNSVYLRKKAKVLGYTPESIVREKLMVKVVTLSDFLAEKNIRQVDLLKIDTEGHEYQCLLGLFNKVETGTRVSRIQLEYHEDDMYLNPVDFKDINSLLEENGFRIEKKIKHPFGDFYELIYKHRNEA